HGAEHSHVVAADAVHSQLGELGSADDVAAANDQADADSHIVYLLDIVGNSLEGVKMKSGPMASGECFAGDLEQHSCVGDRTRQEVIPLPSGSGRTVVPGCSR